MTAENPLVKNITQGSWVPVALAIKIGLIKIMTPGAVYYETNRKTGDPAPTIAPGETGFEGVPIYYRENERIAGESLQIGTAGISSTVELDIYIWCDKADGRIRLDRGE